MGDVTNTREREYIYTHRKILRLEALRTDEVKVLPLAVTGVKE